MKGLAFDMPKILNNFQNDSTGFKKSKPMQSFYGFFALIASGATTPHPYDWVGLWPQNLTESI